jgi:1-deoxy-D-xylulose-5-phosphate reductoisomerase
VPFDRIEVVVHPQQLIHSMVEFVDGSTVAQAGPPRMLVPIALGLSWPDRLDAVDEPVDWTRAQSWEFEPLDDDAFPAVRLARQVGEAGGTSPAVYNAANEVAVDAFHDGLIGFVDIVDTVARVVEEHGEGIESGDLTVEDVMRADDWARGRARKVLGLATQDPTPEAVS